MSATYTPGADGTDQGTGETTTETEVETQSWFEGFLEDAGCDENCIDFVIDELMPALGVIACVLVALMLLQSIYSTIGSFMTNADHYKQATTYQQAERIFEEVSVNFDYKYCKMLSAFVSSGGIMGSPMRSIVWAEVQPPKARKALCEIAGCRYVGGKDGNGDDTRSIAARATRLGALLAPHALHRGWGPCGVGHNSQLERDIGPWC